MYYNLNHQSYLIFMKLEFRPYLRTMDLNKDDWRIKINILIHKTHFVILLREMGLVDFYIQGLCERAQRV